MKTVPLGKTGFKVTPICVGTSALGSHPTQYGYEVSEDVAVASIRKVFEGPLNFIDTSNEYGHGGNSERRIGKAIGANGGVPEDVLIATKVDPIVGSTDFSGDRVGASVDESLERLGLDRLPLVYLHDPEKITFSESMAPNGPVEALRRLKEQGIIGHIGVAGGPIDLMLQYLATELFDVVISHNRFTLVDQSAVPLIQDANRRGVAFVNGAPYGGGMLVKGPDVQTNYCYTLASEATISRVRKMKRLCDSFGVPLAAVALQFSLRNPQIASTIVGMSAPSRIEETLKLAKWAIPDALWEELKMLAVAGRDGY